MLKFKIRVLQEPQYQYQEQPSSEHFEQQPEQYEEGKCNMNNLSHLITISYCMPIRIS